MKIKFGVYDGWAFNTTKVKLGVSYVPARYLWFCSKGLFPLLGQSPAVDPGSLFTLEVKFKKPKTELSSFSHVVLDLDRARYRVLDENNQFVFFDQLQGGTTDALIVVFGNELDIHVWFRLVGRITQVKKEYED